MGSINDKYIGKTLCRICDGHIMFYEDIYNNSYSDHHCKGEKEEKIKRKEKQFSDFNDFLNRDDGEYQVIL